jgi:putative endonuclease
VQETISILQQNGSTAIESLAEFGSRGEALAMRYLESNGYRIVLSNFKVPVGRNSQGAQVTGEIDIIALEGETLCFIEVKTRRSEDFLPAISAIDLRKQRQITRTAKIYRRIFSVTDMSHRFDVVTVVAGPSNEPKIELVKGFWNEGKFRKRTWTTQIWQDFL